MLKILKIGRGNSQPHAERKNQFWPDHFSTACAASAHRHFMLYIFLNCCFSMKNLLENCDNIELIIINKCNISNILPVICFNRSNRTASENLPHKRRIWIFYSKRSSWDGIYRQTRFRDWDLHSRFLHIDEYKQFICTSKHLNVTLSFSSLISFVPYLIYSLIFKQCHIFILNLLLKKHPISDGGWHAARKVSSPEGTLLQYFHG